MRIRKNCFAVLLLIFFSAVYPGLPEDLKNYDPLNVTDKKDIEILDLTVKDKTRNREIPIRIYLPAGKEILPVVLFSHGLGGSAKNSPYLGEHWSSRGYIVVFVQHPGSDTSVWQEKKIGQRMKSMQDAASAENFILRVKDIPAVLDQLEAWNKDDTSKLKARLDMKKIGMSGHSFGAITTQAVSGQVTAVKNFSFTDSRIKAAIALSPSTPKRLDPEKAFGSVKIPWLLMTGTKDISMIGDADLESRLGVFPALPPGDKYEVVLFNAEHSAFTDRPLPGDKEKRNPNHHKVILALSTAFWDVYLKNDSAAKSWLIGDAPLKVMEKEDRWQKK